MEKFSFISTTLKINWQLSVGVHPGASSYRLLLSGGAQSTTLLQNDARAHPFTIPVRVPDHFPAIFQTFSDSFQINDQLSTLLQRSETYSRNKSASNTSSSSIS